MGTSASQLRMEQIIQEKVPGLRFNLKAKREPQNWGRAESERSGYGA